MEYLDIPNISNIFSDLIKTQLAGIIEALNLCCITKFTCAFQKCDLMIHNLLNRCDLVILFRSV